MITGIDTPALIIEKSKLEANILKMQSIADRHGVKLRPHTKTHKMPEIARMQVQNGATGIAVAKIGEAEIMAENGFDDIQIANIVIGESKIKRLIELNDKIVKLSVNVDSIEGARQLSDAFLAHGNWINVYIEINSGHDRSGLREFDRIYELAKFIETCEGLNLLGLFTHSGHAYFAQSREEIEKIGANEGEFLISLADRLMKVRTLITEITVGSTPTAEFCSTVHGVTEIRPGNYVFYDMIQEALGSCSIDECALNVLTTVTGIYDDNRVVIDAGAKALSLDKGHYGGKDINTYGHIVDKNCSLIRVSEEHGIITHEGESFQIGEKIRIIPNHACTAVNLYDKAYLVDGDEIISEFSILGRGKSQ
jgi:D-serine deaminase-like pyridoxal phosphate-dependent protein